MGRAVKMVKRYNFFTSGIRIPIFHADPYPEGPLNDPDFTIFSIVREFLDDKSSVYQLTMLSGFAI